MNIVAKNINGQTVALVQSEDLVIADTQSALDLMMTVSYTTKSSRIAIPKTAVNEDFFRLATGVAGEILQKYVNYGAKIAIYGDYSGYTSKPLKDFIYESNKGKYVFFVATEEEALQRLADAAE